MKSNREILYEIEEVLKNRPLNDREKAEKEKEDRCRQLWLMSLNSRRNILELQLQEEIKMRQIFIEG